jgi:hypothetical protein
VSPVGSVIVQRQSGSPRHDLGHVSPKSVMLCDEVAGARAFLSWVSIIRDHHRFQFPGGSVALTLRLDQYLGVSSMPGISLNGLQAMNGF